MSFKGVFSILSSDSHFVHQSRSILAILVKGHPRKISVKSFLKTGHGPRRRCRLKLFSILSSDSHFVHPSKTILFSPAETVLAILVQGHPRNICMKLF